MTSIDEAPTANEEISPSGRYRLIVQHGCNESRGTVYRISDNKEICDIKRNYGVFFHKFIQKDGQEWIISGRSYLGQTIVNLDTQEEFETPKANLTSTAFCWTDVFLSPDEKTLVAEGCIWACPFEYRFYDFSNPSKGWPDLSTQPDDLFLHCSSKPPAFNPDGTITYFRTKSFYVPLNKSEGEITEDEFDKADKSQYDDESNWKEVVVETKTLVIENGVLTQKGKWLSEEESNYQKNQAEGRAKFEKWLNEFKTSDPLYLKYLALLASSKLPAEKYESYGVTFPGWCSTFTEKETRWCRRIVEDKKQRYTIDLEWGAKTGPIKLVIYLDGNSETHEFFEHSPKGMEEAFTLAAKLYRKS